VTFAGHGSSVSDVSAATSGKVQKIRSKLRIKLLRVSKVG
jgi:hypothetical protein